MTLFFLPSVEHVTHAADHCAEYYQHIGSKHAVITIGTLTKVPETVFHILREHLLCSEGAAIYFQSFCAMIHLAWSACKRTYQSTQSITLEPGMAIVPSHCIRG